MITLAALKTWGATAALAIIAKNPGYHPPTDAVLEGMAHWAIHDPLVEGSDDVIKSMMGIEVAVSWFEGKFMLDPIGSNDGGMSHCWAQIYLGHNGRTREGYTGYQLRTDPMKCAQVAVRLIKASLLASPACDECGLTVYARGRDTDEGRALSRNRMGLAHRLLREVPW
jgi:hypothetical protein